MQRIKEDAHRRYAQHMESALKEIEEVSRAEVIDLHAEDKGEEPLFLPFLVGHENRGGLG